MCPIRLRNNKQRNIKVTTSEMELNYESNYDKQTWYNEMQLNPGLQITSELNNYAVFVTSPRHPYCTLNCNKPRNIQSIFEPSVYRKPNNITNMFFSHLAHDKHSVNKISRVFEVSSVVAWHFWRYMAQSSQFQLTPDATDLAEGLTLSCHRLIRVSRLCNLKHTQTWQLHYQTPAGRMRWDGMRQKGDGGHQRHERCRNTRRRWTMNNTWW